MKHKFSSLASKLFLTVSILFLSFALCFIYFQYQREKNYRIESLNTRLQDCNNDIHDFLETDSTIFLNYINRLKNENIRVTIMDIDGNVRYDSGTEGGSELENHLDRDEISDALKNGSGYALQRESRTLGGQWFYSATLFKDNGLIIRTAHIYDVSMGLMLASDRNYLFLALALSLSLLFIFYVYLYKLQLNISHLRDFADMAEKNQDIRNADITFSNDELGEISRNIVHLYAKLQNSEDDKTRLKRQLTQNIAHELKTPVSSIQGYLETIIDNPDLDETTRNDFLERCHAQSERLGNLISDITLLSKIDDAFTSFSTEEIDVEAMLQNIRKATELDMEAKKMKFLILIAPGTTVHGSQQLIYSIFRNLTDNAIAYAGEGTTITVQCLKEEKNKLWFSFSDNGVGVPPEHLTHLFERFYRVDKGRSRKLGGTGLGLAIVKNAVLLHGGTINVQIAHTGGLDFHFSLNK